MYVLGSSSMLLWNAETSAEFVLAIDRCAEILFPTFSKRMFKGWRAWCWMIPPLSYGFYSLLYEKPCLFSGAYFMWFTNPHIGYLDQVGSEVGFVKSAFIKYDFHSY